MKKLISIINLSHLSFSSFLSCLLLYIALIFFNIFNIFNILNIAYAEFVTIKSTRTNVRTGPGLEYPIKFLYVTRNIPVKVLNVFEDWYQIQDFDNDTGWVMKSLVNKRIYGITKTELFGYKTNNAKSDISVKVDKNVILLVKKCKEDWCYLQSGKYKFYAKKDLIWGIDNHKN